MDVQGSNSTFANTNTSGAVTLEPAPNATARAADESLDASYSVGGQVKATRGPTLHAGAAPTYVNNQNAKYPGGAKGKNVIEGGFDSDDSKNASFMSDIGSENDPGRLAEQKFARVNAAVDASAGIVPKPGGSDGGLYDSLGNASA